MPSKVLLSSGTLKLLAFLSGFLLTLVNLRLSSSVFGAVGTLPEDDLTDIPSNRKLTTVGESIANVIPPQEQAEQQVQPQVQPESSPQEQGERPMTMTLVRGIGNALPPRHDPEQTFSNLNFTLMHEKQYPNMHKHWILNRLMDPVLEARIVRLLESHGESYTVVPFDLEEYAQVPWAYEYDEAQRDLVHTWPYHTLEIKRQCANYTYARAHMTIGQLLRKFRRNCFNVFDIRANLVEESIQHEKNLYVTNQNAVRNLMLEVGIDHYQSDWILPWDGNCFITKKGYEQIYSSLQTHNLTASKYAWTPMARAQENEEVLDDDYAPITIEEPQLIFHRTAIGRFHDRLRYGRRNKIEMIQRLNIPGPWDKWSQYLPWEYKHLDPLLEVVPDAGSPAKTGFVTRLSSGRSHLEVKGVIKARGHSRSESMTLVLSNLDVKAAVEIYGYNPSKLMYFKEQQLRKERLNKIKLEEITAAANEALQQGPWSVTGKRKTLWNPTENPRDYYHPPDETIMELRAKKTDEDRLAFMTGNTTILALGYYMTGNTNFAEVAARNIKTWFLKWRTRMNAHLVNCDIYYNNTAGFGRGIYEMKDIYMLLDAIRILERSNYLSLEEQSDLKDWFRDYFYWLEESVEGKREYTSHDHRGVYYDIQMVSIASYVNDSAKMLYYLDRSYSRLRSHVKTEQGPTDTGRLTQETVLYQTKTPHPRCEENQLRAMQGWTILARLGQSAGRNMWDAYSFEGTSTLCHAAQYNIPMLRDRPQCSDNDQHNDGINYQRWWAVLAEARHYCPNLQPHHPSQWLDPSIRVAPQSAYDMPTTFEWSSAVAPFWNLGMPFSTLSSGILPGNGEEDSDNPLHGNNSGMESVDGPNSDDEGSETDKRKEAFRILEEVRTKQKAARDELRRAASGGQPRSSEDKRNEAFRILEEVRSAQRNARVATRQRHVRGQRHFSG